MIDLIILIYVWLSRWLLCEKFNELLFGGRDACDRALPVVPQVTKDTQVTEHIPVIAKGLRMSS